MPANEEAAQAALEHGSEWHPRPSLRPLSPQFDRVWSYYIVNTPISVPYADYITGAPVQEVLAALQVG